MIYGKREPLAHRRRCLNSTRANFIPESPRVWAQLFQAMNQLERLQRLRKGDHVPAPLNLQVLGEAQTVSDS